MTQDNQTKPATSFRPKSENRRRRRRSSRHMLASTFGVFLLLVLVAVGSLLWRLGQGPVKLSRFLPTLEERFTALVPGYHIDIGRADLIWANKAKRPQLQLGQVQLTKTENGRVSRFSQLRADISLSSLVMGDIKLKKVALDDLDITIERTKEGDLIFSLPGIEGSGGHLDFGDLIESVENGPLSLVSELEIHNLKLSLRDARTGEFWAAPLANATLQSSRNGLEISLETEKLENGWPLRGTANLSPNGQLDLVISGNRINSQSLPPFLTNYIPSLFQGGELDGAFSLTLNESGQVLAARGDVAIALSNPLILNVAEGQIKFRTLTAEGAYEPDSNSIHLDAISLSGQGLLLDGQAVIERSDEGAGDRTIFSFNGQATVLPESGLYPEARTFESLSIKGAFGASTGNIDIDEAMLSSGGVNIQASGNAILDAGVISASIAGNIEDLDVAGLKRLWPQGAAPGASSWIRENVLEGQINNARFFYSTRPGGDENRENLTLDFDFQNVATYHIGRMTPITDGFGQARLTLDKFEMWLEGGHLGDLALSEGNFLITELDAEDQSADVTLKFSGKARQVLEFLDEEPISALTRVKVNPAKISGIVTGIVTAQFPLLLDLALDDVTFKVKARARKLASKDIADGYSIAGGEIIFNANVSQVRAQGTIALNKVPLKFDWTEQFDLSKKKTTDLIVTAKLDDAQRKTFGIDLAPYVEGPVSVKLVKAGKGMDIKRADVEVDLSEALVRIPKTSLVSRRNTPKSLSLTANFDEDIVRVTDISYASPDIQIERGELVLKAGALQSASLSRLKIENLADIGVQYSNINQTGASLNIKGRFLNLSGLLSSDKSNKSADGGLARLDSLPQISVRVALNQFRISKALIIDDFQMALASRPGELNVLKGEARFAGSKPLLATWKRSLGGSRNFIVETKDAGSVLRALGYYDRALGGSLKLTGNFKPASLGKKNFEIKGRALVKNMTIRGASSLSDVLDKGAGATLSSLSEEMKNEGVKIDIVDVPFTIGDTEIAINDAFARGDSVGFTFAGTINREKGRANMGGTIIPAYGLNSYLGNIPLLGRLLVGRAKEGVVGITYSVSGSIDSPNVSVNPLSVLTPGILRRIFDTRGGASSQQTAKRAASPDYPGDEENNADP